MRRKLLSKIVLENCQIKSATKFKLVCAALDTIEIETFVGSGLIEFKGMFICPDFDLVPFYQSGNPTERLIAGMCICLFVKQHGASSPKSYQDVVKEMAARDKRKPKKSRGYV